MRRWLCLAVVPLVVIGIGCSQSEKPEVAPPALTGLDWLLGRWEMVEEDHILCEEWGRVDAVSFGGYGSRISGVDTVQTERLEIRATDSGVFYVAIVPHNPGPVLFRLTEHSDTSAVFENPEHDLPNLISYRLESPGIVRVRVAGLRDSIPTGFELLFARVESAGSGDSLITP